LVTEYIWVIAIALYATFFVLWFAVRKTMINQSKQTPLPKGKRGALSREEKEEYLKQKSEQLSEFDYLDLDAPEERHVPKDSDVMLASHPNIPPEVDEYIYGDSSDQKKFNIKELLSKVFLKKIVEQDYEFTINPTDFKLDDKGGLSIGTFSGKIEPKKNEEKTTPKKTETDTEEEILF